MIKVVVLFLSIVVSQFNNSLCNLNRNGCVSVPFTDWKTSEYVISKTAWQQLLTSDFH